MMKRIVLAALFLCLAVPALLAPAFAAASDAAEPSAEVTEEVSPDPEVSESPEPTIPPEMELLGTVIGATLPFFQREFFVFGFTISYWDIMLFDILAGIVIYLIWRFMR